MSNIEQTLSIIKPDAVERNLQDEIKQEFINKGFEIKKEKKIHISKQEAEQFYKVHETKPFYNELCSYLSSGPIVVMELSRENAILENRKQNNFIKFMKQNHSTMNYVRTFRQAL